jgi:branched-chain amino acid transport system permease protein
MISAHWEQVLMILAINSVVAYGAFLPMAAGQLNLGVAGFVAVGAYTSAWFSNTLGLSPFLTVFIGAFGAGLLALVVAVPVLRTRGIYLALATFALGEVVQAAIFNLEFVGGAAGYPVLQYIGGYGIAAFAIGCFVFVHLLFGTRLGLSLSAVHDDEQVADLFGLNVKAFQVCAFTLGGVLAGLGGALWAHHFSVIEAQNYNVLLSIYIVLYVLLGGTQTVFGPIVGATVFTLTPELLRGINEWRYVLFAVLIILIMVWRPQGVLTREMLGRFTGSRRLRGAEPIT